MTPVTAMILTLAATVWWIVGLRAGHAGSTVHYAIGIAISALLIGVATSRQPATLTPEDDARRGRLVGIASAVEGVLILIAVNLCQNAGRIDLLAPAIAIIVGLHFLPFALRFPAPAYYVPAGGLVLLGVVSVVIVHDPDVRTITVSVGSAIILWLTSAYALTNASVERRS